MRDFLKPETQRRLTVLWWHRVPHGVKPRFPRLADAFQDGDYLAAWPFAAAVAPPTVFVLGWLVGRHYFLPADTFTYSLIILIPIILLTSIGAGIGCWLWLGYVLADFFYKHGHGFAYYNHVWMELADAVVMRLALVICYSLLALLVVGIPLYSERLRKKVIPPDVLPLEIRSKGQTGIQVLFCAGLVYLWTQMFPLMIRPVFLWGYQNAGSPPLAGIEPVQRFAWVLVLAGAVGAWIRCQLEARSAMLISSSPRVTEAAIISIVAPRRRTSRGKAYLKKTAIMVFFFSGMLTRWWEAPAFAVALLGTFITADAILDRYPKWVEYMGRTPLAVKLFSGIALSFVVAYKLVHVWMAHSRDNETFIPVMLALLLSQIFFALLMPARAIHKENAL